MNTFTKRQGFFAGFVGLVLVASTGGAAAVVKTTTPSNDIVPEMTNISLPAAQRDFSGGTVTIISPNSIVRSGQTLEAAISGFVPTPTGYVFRWYRNGVEIPEAVRRGYVVSDSDLGARISLKVTAIKAGYRNKTAKDVALPIILPKKADISAANSELFAQLAGQYVEISEGGDIYRFLQIAADGSFSYVESTLDDYRNSLPQSFECPTIACIYEGSQIGRFGKVTRQANGKYEIQVVAAAPPTAPGAVLDISEKWGSTVTVAALLPFEIGQKLVVTPTKGQQIPADLYPTVCEQYRQKLCKNDKWAGWTVAEFHGFSK